MKEASTSDNSQQEPPKIMERTKPIKLTFRKMSVSQFGLDADKDFVSLLKKDPRVSFLGGCEEAAFQFRPIDILSLDETCDHLR